MMLHQQVRHPSVCLASICLLAALTIAGCERTQTAGQSTMATGKPDGTSAVADAPAALAPAPLLLLDETEDETAGGPTADNSRCFVCHINYVEEQIATSHARQNIGCVHCHGASDAHIADESWGSGGNGTAPEIMYPRDKINPACMPCHTQEKLAATQHDPALATSSTKVCTDCHGNHRLPQRRCKWR